MRFSKNETPWGSWEILEEEPSYKLKRIIVKPGHRLSYQTHSQRREHWIIVKGVGTVVLDGKEHLLQPGEWIDVSMRVPHRMENRGQENVVFVEVQTGTYFGEDDIVRLSDDYGRSSN